MEPIEAGAEPSPARNKRSWIMTAAVATGLAVGAAGLAGAATGGSGSSSTTAPSGAATYGQAPTGQAPGGQPPAGAQDPATMPNGPGETLLTGDDAAKAKAAALAAVPGATVIRVETDSGDAEYEAHLKKADGTMVTVLMDADFTVTGTEAGFGGGPGGHGGPGGPGPGMRGPGGPDAGYGSSSSSTSGSETTT